VLTAPFGSTVIHMPQYSLILNVDRIKIIQSMEQNLSREAGSTLRSQEIPRVSQKPVGIVDGITKGSELGLHHLCRYIFTTFEICSYVSAFCIHVITKSGFPAEVLFVSSCIERRSVLLSEH
jgi:hypothetical protein